MTELNQFLATRDFLLAHRSDYAAACKGFEWPRLVAALTWPVRCFPESVRGG